MKHLVQAHILAEEAAIAPDAYRWHRWLAAGHLAEAEDEAIALYLELAQEIRDARIKYIDQDQPINIQNLISKVQGHMDLEDEVKRGNAPAG